MSGDVGRAQIDPEVKREASTVLAGMGLSLSDAIRLMLVRVAAERALPSRFACRTRRRGRRSGEVVRFDSVDALIDDLND